MSLLDIKEHHFCFSMLYNGEEFPSEVHYERQVFSKHLQLGGASRAQTPPRGSSPTVMTAHVKEETEEKKELPHSFLRLCPSSFKVLTKSQSICPLTYSIAFWMCYIV